MNIKLLKTGMALACALSLTACGGGEDLPEARIKVKLVKVTKEGLKLKLNGVEQAVPPGEEFYFDKPVSINSAYTVELVSGAKPSNAISCTLAAGTGTIGYQQSTLPTVTCELVTYALGGTITGTLRGNLIINNGSATVTRPAGAVDFALPPVPADVPYSVTILKQPEAGSCSVTPADAAGTIAAPTGIMPGAAIGNLNIHCN